MIRGGMAAVVAGGAVVVGALTVLGAATPVSAAATSTSALYEMNEPAGSTVLVDSSGNGRHGTIGHPPASTPPRYTAGATYDGAVGHRFYDRSPTLPPAEPERLDTVPHTTLHNPDSQDFAVTVRYRTKKSFGNLIQKGQNGSAGGYFKIELPHGRPTCLFKGTLNGTIVQRAVKAPLGYELNDNAWHVITCERLQNRVALYIDGVEVRRLVGVSGNIANTKNLSIAGKSACDQIEVTCDYFVGDIDWVRLQKGSAGSTNTPPTAAIASSCAGLACTFSGAGASDPDGTIAAYAWDFGDGSTANGVTTSHSYAAAGTYTVRLTVTDNAGATGTTAKPVTVASGGESPGTITYVGQTSVSGNLLTHVANVPAVQPGDGILLFFSSGSSATVGEPTGVTGWSRIDGLNDTKGSTTVWRKVAADDAGRQVRITLSAQSKGNLTIVAYRGTSAADPVAGFARQLVTTFSAARTTPTATVGVPAVVVSYWMHRDSDSSSLAPPPGVQVRATGTQTGGGRVTVLTADSGTPVVTGAYGNLTATAQAASSLATTWTIVLAPG